MKLKTRLTVKQQKVLDLLHETPQPSLSVMAKAMGYKSRNAVVRHINRLVQLGYATRGDGIIHVTWEVKPGMTPCKRKCWDCGNVAMHADNITPHVNCKKCGSQDTRLVKEKKPPHSPVEAIQKLREDYAEWLELNNYTIGLITRS